MPSFEQVVGASYTAYIPDDATAVELGYTHVRIYWGSSRTGAFTAVAEIALSAGTYDYTYNKTDAAITDWAYHTLVDLVGSLSETPSSEPVRVGPPVATRKLIRQGVGRRLGIMKLLTVHSTPTPLVGAFAAEDLIDQDAPSEFLARHYLRFTSGGNEGEWRRLRTDAQGGYAPATGLLTLSRAFDNVPTVGDEFELWRPKGQEDPSVLIDEAIDRAAVRLWWDETFYLTTDDNVTEYTLPSIVREEFIRNIQYSADTFPDHPAWQSVPRWGIRSEFGHSILSLSSEGAQVEYFSGSTIVKVEFVRHGEALADDDAYWKVPLQWAIAEVALEFLDTLVTPGGGFEQVIDAERARETVVRSLSTWRAAYIPKPQVRTETPW